MGDAGSNSIEVKTEVTGSVARGSPRYHSYEDSSQRLFLVARARQRY